MLTLAGHTVNNSGLRVRHPIFVLTTAPNSFMNQKHSAQVAPRSRTGNPVKIGDGPAAVTPPPCHTREEPPQHDAATALVWSGKAAGGAGKSEDLPGRKGISLEDRPAPLQHLRIKRGHPGSCHVVRVFFCNHPNVETFIMFLYWRIQQDLNELGERLTFYDPSLIRCYRLWTKKNLARLLVAENMDPSLFSKVCRN